MLKLLYLSGMRVSELCRLAWRDVQSDTNGVYITVFGKGGKTRTILLDDHIYKDLVFIRGNGGPDDPVFRSHKGSFLDPSQVWRIVRSAARRAGIGVDVSPHWFRHAHASHALERMSNPSGPGNIRACFSSNDRAISACKTERQFRSVFVCPLAMPLKHTRTNIPAG